MRVLLAARPSKRLWAQEGIPGFSSRELLRRQDATRWPFFYGYSPAVVPRPPDWRQGIEVAGELDTSRGPGAVPGGRAGPRK